VGSNPTEGGGFFRPRPLLRGQQGSNPRPDGPPMDVVCCCIRVVSSRKRRRERVGVGSRGKYPGAPPHHRKDDKNKPTVKGT
jgi:hypothetical protein